MVQRVYKYGLRIADVTSLMLPVGSQILCVKTQGDQVCIWAKVDPDETQFTMRSFLIVGTGHDIPKASIQYLDNVLLLKDNLVLHVFEIMK